MKIKTTKRTLIRHDNNDMCCNWFYLVQGRIINDEGTRYRGFKFVVWFDADELWEHNNKERITQQDLREFTDELAYGQFFCLIKSYDDVKEFFDECNRSINNWNEMCDRQRRNWW